MATGGTFQIDELELSHAPEGDAKLRVDFVGRHLRGSYVADTDLYQRYDKTFEGFLDHVDELIALCETHKFGEVEVHIEELEDVMSRTRQTIYRLLQRIRPHVGAVTVFGSSKQPPQSEHFNMTRVFINKLMQVEGSRGTPMKLVDVDGGLDGAA